MDSIYSYRPRVAVRLEVPSAGDSKETVVITPSVITAKWTVNNHLVADELTITVGWEEGGCDPRLLKNSTIEFYMWDELRQDFKDFDRQYLRFQGVCVKAQRELGEGKSEVTLTFHDYTTLFIHMKPFPTAGMPEYSDSLEQIWAKICDYTGTKDPDTGKIVSKVAILKPFAGTLPDAKAPGLIFGKTVDQRTMGSIVNKRFHEIAKPSIHQGANAWEVWMWCTAALGYVSYIQADTCIVMTVTEHYDEDQAPQMIYGQNIIEFKEESDCVVSGKGVMLKSFDPATQTVLEAVYPLPGDERLKINQATANRAAKKGVGISVNDVSADYQEFQYPSIQTQEALDIRCKEAYEEFSRQQMTGSLKTAEMAIEAADGSVFDILSIQANDPIIIGIDDSIRFAKSEEEAYQYLVDVCKYNDGLARIIARNYGSRELQSPKFHVTTMEVEYNDGACMIDIKYHNLVNLKGIS